MLNSLSLIVPAFNEEAAIKDSIQIYNQKLRKFTKKYEIIVIDDGSTDNTAKILQGIIKKYKKVKGITHKENLGVGRAIWDGFKKARYEWILTNSADQAFNLDDLKRAGEQFKTADVIVFVRQDRSANSNFRKLTSMTSFLLVKLFFRTPIEDFHFVQAYKREILKNVKIAARDTFMPAELLVNLYRRGYNIAQVKAKFYKRSAGRSKYGNPVRYLKYLKELFTFWIKITFNEN
ncbi:glycosyltransferase family 2 protein [Candidatus Microgenomates bacterium]|nr:glycosyltransferase family 2 protein [Candidatus Microgenomates bacterium]